MRMKFKNYKNNGTWSVTNLPPRKKDLGSRWVYRIKYNSDASVECLKAQLVVFGNHQVEWIDYSNTFATILRMTTILFFLLL